MKTILAFIIIASALVTNSTLATSDGFWSGGVGLKERTVIPPGNFHLILAISTGAYLAGIDVYIETSDGSSILRLTSDGPWVCGDLPQGNYRVVAERPETGERQSAYFDLNDGARRTLNLVFKSLLVND